MSDPAGYESAEQLREYLLFHYGTRTEVLPWDFGPEGGLDFPVRCVDALVDKSSIDPSSRSLDVGCAVGRSAFELARYAGSVLGIDFSQSFVDAGNALVREGQLSYEIVETGLLQHSATARVPEDIDRTKVSFAQGDACHLDEALGRFEVVSAFNLLCRLPRPDAFLSKLPSLVSPGGQLVITTPNTWLETFTAKAFWIGGTPETGEPLEALRTHLEPDFVLEVVRDLPFLIREHKRKYQWSVAQATRWRRV